MPSFVKYPQRALLHTHYEILHFCDFSLHLGNCPTCPVMFFFSRARAELEPEDKLLRIMPRPKDVPFGGLHTQRKF